MQQLESVIPDWSGLWRERGEVAHLEISDLDTRSHPPAPGWTLVDVEHSTTRSSQIFRYERTA